MCSRDSLCWLFTFRRYTILKLGHRKAPFSYPDYNTPKNGFVRASLIAAPVICSSNKSTDSMGRVRVSLPDVSNTNPKVSRNNRPPSHESTRF